MQNQIAETTNRNELPIALNQCELSRTAAQFRDNLTFAEWQEAGKKLCRVSAACLWWIGDWINYGRNKYGEKYAAALEIVDYDYQTLRNASWVAGSVELSRRRDNLTWSHHLEVAALKPKEQKKWLEKAEAEKWSVSDLRRAIRQAGADPNAKMNDHTPFNSPTNKIREAYNWLTRQPDDFWTPEIKQLWKKELEPFAKLYQKISS